jgi:hypothetical protein
MKNFNSFAKQAHYCLQLSALASYMNPFINNFNVKYYCCMHVKLNTHTHTYIYIYIYIYKIDLTIFQDEKAEF